MGKRGQITIFIIVAILIIVVVLMFLLIRNQITPGIGQKPEGDPQSFLESCLEEKVKDKIELISSQGGYVENELSKKVDGINVAYLCYTMNNYVSCINQEPVLMDHLKKEIKKATQEDVEFCFASLKKNLENKGYQLSFGTLDYSVDLESKKVILKIDRDLTITKSDETSNYDYFEIIVSDKIYDLALVVQEINSQEATFCNFDTSGYSMFYSDYEIEKFMLGDSTKIYTVKDVKTNEQFVFGVRSCVIPPGIG